MTHKHFVQVGQLLWSFVNAGCANVFKGCSRGKLVGATFAQMLLKLLIRALGLKISWNR